MSALTPSAPAAPLPVHNLGFEDWDATGRPQGWHVGTQDYRVSADCGDPREGKCALKVQSVPGGKATFVPLVQNIGSHHAAGHFIQLAGMIRTEDVQGWAGLWLRVDAPDRPNIALENMSRTGPRGTTPWQRFSITLPVAPDTSMVAFGVLLSGTGTAWFDDLTLTVDRTTRVEPAVAVTAPPRPQPGAALLDDAALELPADTRPKAKAEWVDDARKRARPIRSLLSDEFSDLRFLAPLLEGRRVVQLGESGHGVAEFNWLKARLIKYLQRELGYDVLAFESSLSLCDAADRNLGKASPIEVMRQCIFPVWHSSETLGLFEYLDAERRAGRRVTLAGFDIQNSARDFSALSKHLVALADAVDPELGRAIESHERRIGQQVALEDAGHMSRAYLALAKGIGERRAKLEAGAMTPREVELAIQEARSRSRLAYQNVYGQASDESRRVRDEAMARNLDFVLDRLHPGRKAIVWAHNAHIAKVTPGYPEPFMMGNWVHKQRGAEVYTIGIYMGRGVAAQNNRRLYVIEPPPEDSLEAVLAGAGLRMSFVDFSRAERGPGTDWIFEPVLVREWGTRRGRFSVAQAYDAVIYIDTVTPPEYR